MPIEENGLALLFALVAVLILASWNFVLERRLHRLTLRGKAPTLDDALERLSLHADDLDAFRKELETYLAGVEGRLRQSVQGVSTIRFNPFKGTGAGGNQSFATAFINEQGDGVVISTLYAHEHMSVFAKPLKKFHSEFELTHEEKEAVENALRSLK